MFGLTLKKRWVSVLKYRNICSSSKHKSFLKNIQSFFLIIVQCTQIIKIFIYPLRDIHVIHIHIFCLSPCCYCKSSVLCIIKKNIHIQIFWNISLALICRNHICYFVFIMGVRGGYSAFCIVIIYNTGCSNSHQYDGYCKSLACVLSICFMSVAYVYVNCIIVRYSACM